MSTQMIAPPPASVESYKTATVDSAYVTLGTIQYVKIGRLVLWKCNNLRFASYDATSLSATGTPAFFTGLPGALGGSEMCLLPRSAGASDGYIRMMVNTNGEVHPHYTKISTQEHSGFGWYIAVE